MSKNSVPVRSVGKSPVFLDAQSIPPDLKGITEIVNIRPIKVNVDIILPSGIEADDGIVDLLQKPIWAVLKRYRSLIDKQAQQALQIVLEKHADDKAGSNKNAYSEASSALDKANKYISELMEDFRVDLRKAAAKELSASVKKVSAKELMTIGSASFKEMKIVKGAFAGEVNYSAAEDITKILKSSTGKWVYCVLLKAGNDGLVAVDKKKPVKKVDWSQMKKELSGSIKVFEGILKPTGTTVTFRFLASQNEALKDHFLKDAVANSAKDFAPSKCECGEPLPKMLSYAELKKLPS
jgi:hypothetical protein